VARRMEDPSHFDSYSDKSSKEAYNNDL
jgi:hypothetical protein